MARVMLDNHGKSILPVTARLATAPATWPLHAPQAGRQPAIVR